MKILGVKHNPLSLCTPQVNPTCTDLGSVLGLHSEWPVANHPTESTAGWDGGAFKETMNIFRKRHKIILQLRWDRVQIEVSFDMQRRYIWHLLFYTSVNSEIL
jgi:hypothetical protein